MKKEIGCKQRTFPFSIMPAALLKKVSKRLYGLAKNLNNVLPNFNNDLIQSEVRYGALQYLAMSLSSALINTILFSSVFAYILIMSAAGLSPALIILLSFLSGLGLASFAFFLTINYPKTLLIKKQREIEKELLFALRSLLIRLRAGVPLYDAIVGVANSEHGIVSEEFGKLVNKVQSGMSLTTALEKLVLSNPCEYFRRALWQIINSLKAGANVSDSLESVVNNLGEEQLVKIKNYGAELNPLALMYMMVTVILPTLGLTFLMILGSLMNLEVNEILLYGILAGLGLFQFFFLGIIKSRRPVVIS